MNIPKVAEVRGNLSGKVICFLSGFPDDHFSAWPPQMIDELGKQFKLLFICLPEYNAGHMIKRKWGYSFDEVIDMVNVVVDEHTKAVPCFVVGHDWGSVVALLFQNKYPAKVSRMCLLDVGIARPEHLPIIGLVLILMYQLWWAFSYVISQALSFKLGDVMFKSYQLLKPFIHPCPNDTFQCPESDCTVGRCYPYFQFAKAMALGNPVKVHFPSCPLLYMVGVLLIY